MQLKMERGLSMEERKIPALLVPPEHKTQIMPLLKEISNID